MRSIRVLVSVARVADRLFQFHALPVCIQFIGKNERDGRAAGGTHLRPMSHDKHGAIGINSHKGVGVQDSLVGVSGGPGLGRPQHVRNEAHTKNQSAGGDDSLQKTATADIQNVVAHTLSPAAALIAARILW